MPGHERVAELTAELVGVPSHDGEADVQERLAALLESCGFACELDEVAPGRPNLLARRGSGGLLLCSHADTHAPHAHPDPFTCRREDDLLIGRGVLDAKGQIAAAVRAFETTPAPATLLVTCDEEDGGLGSERLGWDLRHADGGLVLEPTGGAICAAQAGCIDLALEVGGVGGHAHAPDALSSFDALSGALDALGDAAFLRTRHPLFPAPEPRVGRLEAGEHLWRRPAHARAEVALPLVPGVDPAAARREVAATLDALAGAWRVGGPELGYEILDVCEPHEVPADLPVIGALRRIVPEAELGGMPSWTDAANLAHHHGIRCAVYGAGGLASAHSDREWVRLDDLAALAETLVRLLEASTLP